MTPDARRADTRGWSAAESRDSERPRTMADPEKDPDPFHVGLLSSSSIPGLLSPRARKSNWSDFPVDELARFVWTGPRYVYTLPRDRYLGAGSARCDFMRMISPLPEKSRNNNAPVSRY